MAMTYLEDALREMRDEKANASWIESITDYMDKHTAMVTTLRECADNWHDDAANDSLDLTEDHRAALIECGKELAGLLLATFEPVKGDAVARIQRGMDNQLYAMLLPSPCAKVHAGQVLYTHPKRTKVPDGWEIDVGKKNAAIRHRSGQKLVIKKDLGNVLLFDLLRELAAAPSPGE